MKIWRRGNPQSRLLLLQEYGCQERQSWTIRSQFVSSLFEYFVYLSYLCYFVYVLDLFWQSFGLTCIIEPRSDSLWNTDSVVVLGMIGHKDKTAGYLYEFHADSYASHGLPPLPDDLSKPTCMGHMRLKYWGKSDVKTCLHTPARNFAGGLWAIDLSSYACPEFRRGPLSYGWIALGSAKFYCCSRSYRRQTFVSVLEDCTGPQQPGELITTYCT